MWPCGVGVAVGTLGSCVAVTVGVSVGMGVSVGGGVSVAVGETEGVAVGALRNSAGSNGVMCADDRKVTPLSRVRRTPSCSVPA